MTYNQFDGKMIECVGTDPSRYTSANWYCVFLVNLIDEFMANIINVFHDSVYKTLFVQAINDKKNSNT